MRWEVLVSLLIAATLVFVLRDNIIVQALGRLALSILTLISVIGSHFGYLIP